jgi:hypothetical protein
MDKIDTFPEKWLKINKRNLNYEYSFFSEKHWICYKPVFSIGKISVSHDFMTTFFQTF